MKINNVLVSVYPNKVTGYKEGYRHFLVDIVSKSTVTGYSQSTKN